MPADSSHTPDQDEGTERTSSGGPPRNGNGGGKDALQQLLDQRQAEFDAAVRGDAASASFHARSAEGFVLFRGLRDPSTDANLGELAKELFGKVSRNGHGPNGNGNGVSGDARPDGKT